MQLLLELMVSGMLAGIKIGIAAVGFALIFYSSKEMHFAFGAISVAAAYVCYWTVSGLGGGAPAILLGIVAAFAFSILFSVGVHRFVYVRLRSLMPVIMSSLGLSLLIENTVQILGSPDTRILVYAPLIQVLEIGPIRLRVLELLLIVIFAAVTVGVDLFINRTRIGQGFAATIDDPVMAELVGIRTARMRIGAYSAGAALGAFSGMAMLVDTGIRPAQGFVLMLYALIITIMGRGSLRAVAIWAVLFGVLRSAWSWAFPTHFQELAMFALMMSYLVGREAWERYKRNRMPVASKPVLSTQRAVQGVR